MIKKKKYLFISLAFFLFAFFIIGQLTPWNTFFPYIHLLLHCKMKLQ